MYDLSMYSYASSQAWLDVVCFYFFTRTFVFWIKKLKIKLLECVHVVYLDFFYTKHAISATFHKSYHKGFQHETTKAICLAKGCVLACVPISLPNLHLSWRVQSHKTDDLNKKNKIKWMYSIANVHTLQVHSLASCE
jgi:hypothetical protein